ncbi:MAG: hypothetical protein V9G19_21345 [Tetrasphaera sp.]
MTVNDGGGGWVITNDYPFTSTIGLSVSTNPHVDLECVIPTGETWRVHGQVTAVQVTTLTPTARAMGPLGKGQVRIENGKITRG